MDTLTRDDPRSLADRLQNPETVAGLNRLLDKLDTIEATLNAATTLTSEAPAFVAMAGDTVDGVMTSARRSGVDVNEHLANALQLAGRLTDTKTRATLETLLDLSDQLPNLTAMLADTVDGLVGRTASSGVNLTERTANLVQLAEALSRKETTAQLLSLLELAQGAPAFISMLVDTLDGYSRAAQADGVDLEKSVTRGLAATLKLAAELSPERLEVVNALLTSLDGDSTRVALAATKALASTQARTPQQVGALGLLGQLNDPDVQRALGFFTTFAKHFGQNLK